MAHVYKIGAVSQQTGLSVSTLRLWEDQYELLTPARTTGGTRLYCAADIQRARTIRRLVREQRYSLSAIAELLDGATSVELPPSTDASVHAVVRRLVRATSAWQAAISLLDGVKALTGLRTTSLGIYRPQTGSLSFVLTSRDNRMHRQGRPPLDVSSFPRSWQEAIEARQPYADGDLSRVALPSNISDRVSEDRSRSFHAEPLTIAERLVGVLVISSPEPGGIVERARDLCERLAVPAGPAIQYFAEQL